MEGLLKELVLHQGLAKVFETLGTQGFWRAMLQLLRQLAPIDTALVVEFYADASPKVIEEFTFGATGSASSPMPHYCKGLYLLDPFYRAACERPHRGLLRLDDVAPDQFRQSEYYQLYFSREVGQDEVQFLLSFDGGAVLSLSLGASLPFDMLAIGRLMCVQSWVLAAMQRHNHRCWSESQRPPSLLDRLDRTLDAFGSGRLSQREAEIARLALRGFSSKAIAQQLTISPETVKVHRRNLYNKLGIASHAELFNSFLAQCAEREGK